MIRTRIFDFAISFIIAMSAFMAAQSFVAFVHAWLFCGCVGAAIYVKLQHRREGER